MQKGKKHIQFSKIITAVNTFARLPLTVYVVWKCLEIASDAVTAGFSGALPYVTAIVGFVEACDIAILGFYHDNSKTEKKVRGQSGSVQTSADTVQTAESSVQTEEYHPAVNLNIDF
ncbi:MAG: hypothetical protein E7584_04375 [Ruminococcaceae bacterium]|nr:hypothetical protein [Oscillospiraceae bacterium]